MNGGVFSEQILADKLSKLNNTQQCIETLSHWCIFHRKNSALIVETWDKQFRNSEKEQKIPFLNLANDILQNSKKTGNEFVEEFWKVLPTALREVYENGGDRGKSAASRLVDIWQERRVFGSRAHGIKDMMLGNEPLPALDLSRKQSRGSSIKIVRRDSRSVRIKLKVGGTPEKIISAFHSVLSEHAGENTDLDKCHSAARHFGRMEKDVNIACAKVGDPRRKVLSAELKNEEANIKQCVEKLKLVEINRSMLVSELKEALSEQESELEKVRTQLQLAEAMVGRAAEMIRRLDSEEVTTSSQMEAPLHQPSSDPNGHAADGTKKSAAAIAAEVADKLAASTNSQQIMRSVLSSFAAEEAKNASSDASASSVEVQAEKKLKVEHSSQTSIISAGTALIPVQPVTVASTIQPPPVFVQQPPLQTPAPVPLQQYLYQPPAQQFLQPPPGIMIGMPYPMNSQVFTPPTPQIHAAQASGLPRPAPMATQPTMLMPHPSPGMPPSLPFSQQPMQLNGQMMPPNQQPMQFALQPPVPPNFRPLQPPIPPGMGYYQSQPQ